MAEQNPNLMSKSQMQTMASTSGSGKLLMHEILTKVNNAKAKPIKPTIGNPYSSIRLRDSTILFYFIPSFCKDKNHTTNHS